MLTVTQETLLNRKQELYTEMEGVYKQIAPLYDQQLDEQAMAVESYWLQLYREYEDITSTLWVDFGINTRG